MKLFLRLFCTKCNKRVWAIAIFGYWHCPHCRVPIQPISYDSKNESKGD